MFKHYVSMVLMLYWLPIATTEEEDSLNDLSEYSSHGNKYFMIA